ncbi:MAG: tetratricopeptide repeat protein, partial [Flavobacteriales bacterium]|nr:tetratricopeptide repeat protein [Flavobacteriales bacterium]
MNIIINNNSNDTSLAGAFVGLSEILYVSNQDTMLPLCNKSLSIIKKALKNNVSEKERFSLLKSKALALNNIGYIYDNKGDIPKALEYFHESLKIKEEINDKQGIASSYNNIGMLYSK